MTSSTVFANIKADHSDSVSTVEEATEILRKYRKHIEVTKCSHCSNVLGLDNNG